MHPRPTWSEIKHAAGGGLVSGYVGGGVLVLLFIVHRGMRSGDAWLILKMLTEPLLGGVAIAPGFNPGAALLGTFLHFAVASAWGAMFGVLVYGRASRGGTIVAGAAFGLIVWLVMFYVAMPIAGATEIRGLVSVPAAIMGHLAYGFSMGVSFTPFQKRRGESEPPKVVAAGREPSTT